MEAQTIVFAVFLWLVVIYVRDLALTDQTKEVSQTEPTTSQTGHQTEPQYTPKIPNEMHHRKRSLDDAELEDEFADIVSEPAGADRQSTPVERAVQEEFIETHDIIPEISVKFCTS
mmetsp:Transcript_1694/g.2299  ORF Transcript_1694/g.2299 Transcript_1694/m.2299 type:complete len:116 (+) Transcript_1694:182-529(+)